MLRSLLSRATYTAANFFPKHAKQLNNAANEIKRGGTVMLDPDKFTRVVDNTTFVVGGVGAAGLFYWQNKEHQRRQALEVKRKEQEQQILWNGSIQVK